MKSIKRNRIYLSNSKKNNFMEIYKLIGSEILDIGEISEGVELYLELPSGKREILEIIK